MMKRKVALLMTTVMLVTSVFPAGITAYAEEVVSPDVAVIEADLGEMPDESADTSAVDGDVNVPDENAGTEADAAKAEEDVQLMEDAAQQDGAVAEDVIADETEQDALAEEDAQGTPIVADGDVVVSDVEVMDEVSTVEAEATPRTVTPMPIGKMVSVSIPSDGYACYSFTPTESGCYTIVSYAKTYDPEVYIFDGSYDINGEISEGNALAFNDDNDGEGHVPNFQDNNLNFLLTYKNFIAGKKYYYVIERINSHDDTSFSVCVYKTDADGHCWGPWSVPTQGKAVRTRTCVICNKSESQNFTPVLTLTANKLTMKTKQTTSKLKVEAMTEGDSLLSVKSNKTKLLKVSNVNPNGTFKLKAQGKTGTAKLTITLKSGATKTIKVKIQTAKVKTTKVKVSSKKLTLKKKQKHKLTTVITPVTSYDKVTYSTSNKKVATVSKKGLIAAKGKGKATITVKSGNKTVKVKVAVK